MKGFIFEVPFPLRNCRIGSIGGVSIPFQVTATYVGLLSAIVGQQLTITTASCSSPESGAFIVLGKLVWCVWGSFSYKFSNASASGAFTREEVCWVRGPEYVVSYGIMIANGVLLGRGETTLHVMALN